MGDAAQIISSLESAAANYEVAWKLICDRYENKRVLIQNNVKALFAFQCNKKESSTHLREMLDTISVHLRASISLGQPVEHWDTILIVALTSKIDDITAREWETHTKGQQEFPNLDDFKQFLREKATMLDNLKFNKEECLAGKNMSFQKQKNSERTLVATNLSCYYCKGNHTVYTCTDFLQLGIEERLREVQRLKLCVNCIRSGHTLKDCKSSGCRRCKGKHNSLLHKEKPAEPGAVTLNAHQTELHYLLPTALVSVIDKQGRVRSVLRALLDTGSQSNFITQETADYLKIQVQPLSIKVSGVNNSETSIIGRCWVEVKSRSGPYSQDIQCLVIPTITSELPHAEINVGELGVPKGLNLADPNFASPSSINILLGAGIFFEIAMSGKLCLGPNKPTMLETQLGWIVAGGLDKVYSYLAAIKCNVNKSNDVQTQLAKFLELEECDSSSKGSDNFCKSHFLDNVERNKEGRFLSYERRLHSNSKLKVPYIKFMKEYESLGHMTRVTTVNSNEHNYWLPHHGVTNEASSTTKLRVVFDASNPSSSGYSLNSLQGVGPQIQNDLFSILTRFRQHPIAISADITKMYRQILVHENYRGLQQIFWRSDPSEPLQVFQLNTVTYGTASAPFLAVRCLHQLGIENINFHPNAAMVILNDFYVDDLLSGCQSVEEVLGLSREITSILEGGCFPLRKWISNSSKVVQALECTSNISCLNLGEFENTKTLGLYWNPIEDSFVFNISENPECAITKRSILSMTGQIFDPLGLDACTVTAKMLLQWLWHEKVDWDDPVSSDLEQKWLKFRKDLVCLNSLKVPRFVLGQWQGNHNLHGFADASERAYGACVYISSPGAIVTLVASKSRVAPVKTQTIPRLELCAALLLAHLVRKVQSAFRLSFESIYLWSDSTIVLSWLQQSRGDFKIFVSNRVGQIQDLTKNALWRYVPSKLNPADLISRGVSPMELLQSKLWWQGPSFLIETKKHWPENLVGNPTNAIERRSSVQVFAATTISYGIVERFSSLIRAKRVIAYCLRFCAKYRPHHGNSLQLNVDELDNAFKVLIKLTQECYYSDEIKALGNQQKLRRDSKILALNPFLDENQILRVGGRLQFSNLSEDQKHAIILPPKCHLSLLIFRSEHIRLGHAGVLQLLSSVRDRFWPIHGRNMAKKVVGSCVRCYQAKPVNTIPIMGSLPKERVTPSFPFLITGIDYAGPFYVQRHKGRGSKLEKAYLALFLCFSTKAVHIEVVPDLSSEAFIASLKRFVARRGKPRQLYSDNGTNFVGACNALKDIIKRIKANTNVIFDELANEGIKWNFIPASAPHFGGIWEAGVKRVKFHLKRIIGDRSLTFEGLSTLTCQIEAILNSRPLTPLSNDPQDLEVLTPSHFLIGRRLTSIVEPCYGHLPTNRCSSYQHIQQMVQHFWSRWSQEYLPGLQSRNKWKRDHPSTLKINDLVLIKEDHHPPLSWPIGRIEEVFRGKDGSVRVASVRSKRGIFRRPATKLFPLPIDDQLTPSSTVHDATDKTLEVK